MHAVSKSSAEGQASLAGMGAAPQLRSASPGSSNGCALLWDSCSIRQEADHLAARLPLGVGQGQPQCGWLWLQRLLQQVTPNQVSYTQNPSA